jgi:ADP-heptose:LPS heptosyltransferase
MCDEVRRRHPGKLIVFITAPLWQEVVVLSGLVDLVYASKWWRYPFTFPKSVKAFGLVDKIYNPLTTSERLSQTSGMACHLIEDLAASCGFTLTAARLPKLHPSIDLIETTRSAQGLHGRTSGQGLIIGINPGPNWPVKEWERSKWQKLIDRIHSNFDATILQFGINKDSGSSEYANLTGVTSLAGRLRGEELVALIAACDLIVSIDSGPVHIAGAVGTPVIGLFGPLDPALVLPRESAAIGLFANVPCLFCHNKTPVIHWITGCPNDIACMKKLDEETVFGAVESLLAKSKTHGVKESAAVVD